MRSLGLFVPSYAIRGLRHKFTHRQSKLQPSDQDYRKSLLAREKIESNIAAVSLPVFVFCRDG